MAPVRTLNEFRNTPNPRTKPCSGESCRQGKPRQAIPGERFCSWCRASIKHKMQRDGYLTKVIGRDDKCAEYSNIKETFVQGGKLNDDTAEKFINSATKALTKGNIADYKKLDDGKDVDIKHKSLVYGNSITHQFRSAGKKAAKEIYAKFASHPRFIKLNNGFPPVKIKNDKQYAAMLRRALSVEVENRAANYAYLKLVDLRLEWYEKSGGNGEENSAGYKARIARCNRIWLALCDEMEREGDQNREE